MKELHLSIVSPEKSIFDGDVKIVTLPGMIGSFSILPGHAPIVSSLKAGTLAYTTTARFLPVFPDGSLPAQRPSI